MTADRVDRVHAGGSLASHRAGDPAALVDRWRDARLPDVEALAVAMVAARLDAAAAVAVEAMLTPVERGQLAAALDTMADPPRHSPEPLPAEAPNRDVPAGVSPATATRLSTTDQRTVVRRQEVALDQLPRDPAVQAGLSLPADAGEGVEAQPDAIPDAGPAPQPSPSVEILPPLPQSAALPPPIAGRA